MRIFPPQAKRTESGFSSETSNASTDAPAPSGDAEKSNETAGLSSEISPRSLAYFLSVTLFTTAPQVESSSLTSSFSSTTTFSGTPGSVFSAGLDSGSACLAASAAGASDLASAITISFVAAIAACSAAYFARSLARPISDQTYQARTAPRRIQMIFSVLFICDLSLIQMQTAEYFTIFSLCSAKRGGTKGPARRK